MSDTGKTNFSQGGQVQYIDGSAYGINQSGRPICLGKEDDLRKAIENNKTSNSPIINQILSMEWEQRVAPVKPARRATAAIRRSK